MRERVLAIYKRKRFEVNKGYAAGGFVILSLSKDLDGAGYAEVASQPDASTGSA